MATLTARCPGCNKDIRVDADGVRVTVYANAPDRSHVTYTCPLCGGEQRRVVDIGHISQLKMTDALITVTTIPDEFFDARRTADTLVLDELIELHRALEEGQL